MNMLTLYELRRMITVPEDGEVIPTAKQLKESEIALIKKKLGKDVEISVYQGMQFIRYAVTPRCFQFICVVIIYMPVMGASFIYRRFFLRRRNGIYVLCWKERIG